MIQSEVQLTTFDCTVWWKNQQNNSKPTELINKTALLRGRSGNTVDKLVYSNGETVIMKRFTISKFPTEKQFFNYWKPTNYSLLRELIVYLVIKNSLTVIKMAFIPQLFTWHIQSMPSGKYLITLITEYIENIPFETFITPSTSSTENALSRREYIKLFITFFKNLHAMYTQLGLIHRDLKLDNILFTRNKIYLIDFGRTSYPQLPHRTIKSNATEFAWSYYRLYPRKRAYNSRTFTQVGRNTNHSHYINNDLRSIVITMIQGYRTLFNTVDSAELDFTKVHIQELNALNDYGKQLDYIVSRLTNARLQ
jgi:serine/threonine protein kinase